MAQSLATLAAALEWLELHWDENRAAPLRVHESRTTDGALGGLRYSHAFAKVLGASPSDIVADERTAPCGHPLLPLGRETRDCPECQGGGTKVIQTDRYRYAMWRALTALQNALRPRRQLHPYQLVLGLAAHDWDARRAARSESLPWEVAEALYLRAIRQLHGRYQAGPIGRPSWINKSDSQRAAESAA